DIVNLRYKSCSEMEGQDQKKYRVLLNRVDTSTSQDIEWPALP
ncbi:tail fiber assembly protein, partial [Escherichia coli]|nr:tail fiber assembly protein [Escherichia coli]